MSEFSELQLEPVPGMPPPAAAPELTAPLLPGEAFFHTLPERHPPSPSILGGVLVVHALLFGLLVYFEKELLSPPMAKALADLKSGAAGLVGAPGERQIPVQIVPRPPASALRPPAPDTSKDAVTKPPPEAVEVPPPPEPSREYTHIIQPEKEAQKPAAANLFSDKDRAGATLIPSPTPNPRSVDPASKGKDGRRIAEAAPGEDRPGEPGQKEPRTPDQADNSKSAGQSGANGRNGEGGEGGERIASAKPAMSHSGGTIYSGVPLSPSGGNRPAGRASTGPTGMEGAGPGGRPGPNGKTGAPGETTGETSIRSQLRQLEELARSGKSDVFNNPLGKNYQIGALSFDTQGYDLGDYDRRMHQAVEREWNPPSVPIQNHVAGCSLVFFTIERNGRVSEVTLVNTSGEASYDRAAMNALRNAKLPPLPAKMPLARMSGRAAFIINEPARETCGTPVAGGPDDPGRRGPGE